VIEGEVRPGEHGMGLDAVIPLVVRGPGGAEYNARATIDTGFHGGLGLPAETIEALGLPYHSSFVAVLADGRLTQMRLHEGAVDWDGRRRRVLIAATEGGAIVGMELMKGHTLTADIRDGGSVTLEETE
jgi:predicted aspartyl protease